MAEIGFALTNEDIQAHAILLAKESGLDSFKGSDGWLHRFKGRYPSLVTKLLQPFDRLRAGAMNIDIVAGYFELLQKSFERVAQLSQGRALTANWVFNVDETGFERYMRA